MRVASVMHFAPIALTAWLLACAPARTAAVRVANKSAAAVAAQANLTQEDLRLLEQHCPFGRPKLNSSWGFGPTEIVTHDGYVLQHSSTDKIPLWVCEGVTRDQVTGNLPRRNPFKPDPKLAPGKRSELRDYAGSGYDRGHQAPAGNQTRDQRLKDETFFLSNMAPQDPDHNQQIWGQLEEHARRWAETRGHVHIITGPMFWDPEEDDPATADGIIPYFEIGPGKVAVPTHFYKIVVAKNAAGDWESIAFVMENRRYERPFRLEQFLQSIDWIEERTGIDFMADLSLEDESVLEGRAATAMWTPED